MISHSMFLEAGFAFVSVRKVKGGEKSVQKHFSQATRPRTKTAVNWSRFHFLITFSWGTMARPLPNLGHSRPLTFFPRQRSPHSTLPDHRPGSLRKCYGEMWQTHLCCLLGKTRAGSPCRAAAHQYSFAFLVTKKHFVCRKSKYDPAMILLRESDFDWITLVPFSSSLSTDYAHSSIHAEQDFLSPSYPGSEVDESSRRLPASIRATFFCSLLPRSTV